jgi:hypothetical protein
VDGNCTFSWAQAEKMRQTESIVARSSFCVISRPTVIIFDRIIIPKLPTSTVKSFSFRHGTAVRCCPIPDGPPHSTIFGSALPSEAPFAAHLDIQKSVCGELVDAEGITRVKPQDHFVVLP